MTDDSMFNYQPLRWYLEKFFHNTPLKGFKTVNVFMEGYVCVTPHQAAVLSLRPSRGHYDPSYSEVLLSFRRHRMRHIIRDDHKHRGGRQTVRTYCGRCATFWWPILLWPCWPDLNWSLMFGWTAMYIWLCWCARVLVSPSCSEVSTECAFSHTLS